MDIIDGKIGVLKEIDSLGRLVIPKEFRQRLNLDNEVELVITEQGILVRNPKYKLVLCNNSVAASDKQLYHLKPNKKRVRY